MDVKKIKNKLMERGWTCTYQVGGFERELVSGLDNGRNCGVSPLLVSIVYVRNLKLYKHNVVKIRFCFSRDLS